MEDQEPSLKTQALRRELEILARNGIELELREQIEFDSGDKKNGDTKSPTTAVEENIMNTPSNVTPITSTSNEPPPAPPVMSPARTPSHDEWPQYITHSIDDIKRDINALGHHIHEEKKYIVHRLDLFEKRLPAPEKKMSTLQTIGAGAALGGVLVGANLLAQGLLYFGKRVFSGPVPVKALPLK